MGGEPKVTPTTMFGDPILSSEHVRSSSHDSGLGGPTNFPYSSETPMVGDYDDSMDTSAAIKFHPMMGMRGTPTHRSLDFLTDIAGGDVDSFSDPNAGAMETDFLSGGEIGGQWV